MKRALRSINHLLQKSSGLKLVQVDRRPRASDEPSLLAHQFLVPIADCVSGWGFSCDPRHGYHPLTALLAEYECSAGLAYEQSSLKTFYEVFNPRNLQEALLGEVVDAACRTAGLRFTEDFNKLRVPAMPMPWSTPAQIRQYLDRSYQRGGRLDGAGHFSRTINTFRSIRDRGFDPAAHSDGSVRHAFIRVVLLRDGNVERFVILGGQHRVAALANLLWEQVPVIFEYHLNQTPAVVDLRNAASWPVVQMGLYDLRAAGRVFDALTCGLGQAWGRRVEAATASSGAEIS